MSDSFETQIDKIVINTSQRLLAVVRTAISDTINEAQVPTAQGGKMRVDTGFLRSSGVASLEGMPFGPSRGDKDKSYQWNGDFLNIILAKLNVGDTFYWGWTAHYAKYREVYDGFLESALQNWQGKVDAAVQRFRNKDMSK